MAEKQRLNESSDSLEMVAKGAKENQETREIADIAKLQDKILGSLGSATVDVAGSKRSLINPEDALRYKEQVNRAAAKANPQEMKKIQAKIDSIIRGERKNFDVYQGILGQNNDLFNTEIESNDRLKTGPKSAVDFMYNYLDASEVERKRATRELPEMMKKLRKVQEKIEDFMAVAGSEEMGGIDHRQMSLAERQDYANRLEKRYGVYLKYERELTFNKDLFTAEEFERHLDTFKNLPPSQQLRFRAKLPEVVAERRELMNSHDSLAKERQNSEFVSWDKEKKLKYLEKQRAELKKIFMVKLQGNKNVSDKIRRYILVNEAGEFENPNGNIAEMEKYLDFFDSTLQHAENMTKGFEDGSDEFQKRFKKEFFNGDWQEKQSILDIQESFDECLKLRSECDGVLSEGLKDKLLPNRGSVDALMDWFDEEIKDNDSDIASKALDAIKEQLAKSKDLMDQFEAELSDDLKKGERKKFLAKSIQDREKMLNDLLAQQNLDTKKAGVSAEMAEKLKSPQEQVKYLMAMAEVSLDKAVLTGNNADYTLAKMQYELILQMDCRNPTAIDAMFQIEKFFNGGLNEPQDVKETSLDQTDQYIEEVMKEADIQDDFVRTKRINEVFERKKEAEQQTGATTVKGQAAELTGNMEDRQVIEALDKTSDGNLTVKNGKVTKKVQVQVDVATANIEDRSGNSQYQRDEMLHSIATSEDKERVAEGAVVEFVDSEGKAATSDQIKGEIKEMNKNLDKKVAKKVMKKKKQAASLKGIKAVDESEEVMNSLRKRISKNSGKDVNLHDHSPS